MKKLIVYRFCHKPLFWFLHRKIRRASKGYHTERVYTLTKSCIKGVKEENLNKWNKLCGISCHADPHIESYRFGWRYSLEKELFEICLYTYVNKERIVHYEGHVAVPDIAFTVGMLYDYETNKLMMLINSNLVKSFLLTEIPYKFYECGIFVGGKNRAISKMIFKLYKVI